MSAKMISVSVESSSYDLMEALTTVVTAAKAANAGGPVAEAEAAGAALITTIMPILSELEGMKADLNGDHTGFYRGLMNGGLDLGTVVMGK